MGICPYILTGVMNDRRRQPYVRIVVLSSNVSNFAGLSHCAAILETCCPQRFPRADLYADASASGVLRPPPVLGVAIELVKHPPWRIMPNATAEAAGLPRDV